MTISDVLKRLRINREVLMTTIEDVSDEQSHWKSDEDSWSVVEIVNHLADEEVEDFRAAAEMLIFHPTDPWPDIDPMGWVTDRDYQARNLNESMTRFQTERDESVRWLESLPEPRWESGHQAQSNFPKPMSVGDLLGAWIAHDYFHIRQLNRMKWRYLDSIVSPYSTLYAGGGPE